MNPPNTEAHDKEQGTHYKELNPVKDPEKSFNVDISELLQDHLTNLVRGRVPPNFNSAALLPQGSSCVYDKKVECLSNSDQLHQKLAKEQKAEQQNRKETAKEKERQKEEKLSDTVFWKQRVLQIYNQEEYLSKVANQLHQKLAKKQKAEQQNRKETAKEKERQKEEKLSDTVFWKQRVLQIYNQPFFSTEIKLGKNLSCLKSVPKNAVNKQPCKKTQLLKSPFVPMLNFEDDEKGDVIFNTKGEIVGHKGDFILNKCTLTSSGWLLLPTMSRDLIPSDPTGNDYIEEESEKEDYCDTDDVMPTYSGDPSPSLDVGLGTDPQSVSSNSQNVLPDGCSVSASNDEGVGTIDSPQSSAVPNSQNKDSDLTPFDQPLASSEGQNDIYSDPTPSCSFTPSSSSSDQPQTEEQEGNTNPPAKPAELDSGVDDDDEVQNSTESLAVKKPIQKGNTIKIPAKLRKPRTEFPVNSIREYTTQRFYQLHKKLYKYGYCNFEMTAFAHNPKFVQRLTEKMEFLEAARKKNKKSDESDDDEDEVVIMRDYDSPDSPPDTDFLPPPLEDADIRFEN